MHTPLARYSHRSTKLQPVSRAISFPSASPMTASSLSCSGRRVRLAIVGAPPFARGSDTPGHDLELQLVRAFPKCALFVEKPVSSGPEDACWRVAAELKERRMLVSVGYMLRYSKGERMPVRSWPFDGVLRSAVSGANDEVSHLVFRPRTEANVRRHAQADHRGQQSPGHGHEREICNGVVSVPV